MALGESGRGLGIRLDDLPFFEGRWNPRSGSNGGIREKRRENTIHAREELDAFFSAGGALGDWVDISLGFGEEITETRTGYFTNVKKVGFDSEINLGPGIDRIELNNRDWIRMRSVRKIERADDLTSEFASEDGTEGKKTERPEKPEPVRPIWTVDDGDYVVAQRIGEEYPVFGLFKGTYDENGALLMANVAGKKIKAQDLAMLVPSPGSFRF